MAERHLQHMRFAAAPAPRGGELVLQQPASNTATCQGVGLVHLQPKGGKGTRVGENFCLGCVIPMAG